MKHTQAILAEPQPLTPDEIMSEATIKRAAALAAAGASKYKVQKELGISQYYTNKIWRDDLFKKLLEEIGNDAVAASKSQLKGQLAKLSTLAIKALEVNLKKFNLQAAVTVLRSMGVETAKDGDEKQQGFTLVLAGQKQEPKTVVVQKNEDEE
jgi:hypothetical protein